MRFDEPSKPREHEHGDDEWLGPRWFSDEDKKWPYAFRYKRGTEPKIGVPSRLMPPGARGGTPVPCYYCLRPDVKRVIENGLVFAHSCSKHPNFKPAWLVFACEACKQGRLSK